MDLGHRFETRENTPHVYGCVFHPHGEMPWKGDLDVASMKTCRNGLHQYEPGLRECPVCLKARRLLAYKSNPEKFIARTIAWQRNNPEKYNAKSRAWVKRNIGPKTREKWAKKNAALKRATPLWAKKHKAAIEAFYKEARRLSKISGKRFTVDHIVPIQGIDVSGLHVPWNLQVMTLSDNVKKGRKHGGYAL